MCQFCQPGKKFAIYYRHPWKVPEGLRPRSDMMLLMFSNDHSRCSMKDGVQGAKIDKLGDCCRSRWEVIMAGPPAAVPGRPG